MAGSIGSLSFPTDADTQESVMMVLALVTVGFLGTL